jgi:hypothetical protein
VTSPPEGSRGSVDDIFGEPLPRISADERDPSSPADDEEHERWLRENRPPHHD